MKAQSYIIKQGSLGLPNVVPAKLRTVISYRFVKMACAEWGCGESGGSSLPAQRAACTCPAACSPVSRLNRDTLATSRRSQNYANKVHHTSRYWIKCLIILIRKAVDKIDEFTTYHFCKTFIKLSRMISR